MNVKFSHFYFPKGMRFTAFPVFGVVAWLLIEQYYGWAFLLLALNLFILTAKYVTEIDLAKREFRDAFAVLGIGFVTERKSFQKINAIIITRGSHSQRVHSRASSRQFDWSDYTGTMIYDDTGELPLITNEDKSKVVQAVRVYATSLQCGVEDRSVRRA